MRAVFVALIMSLWIGLPAQAKDADIRGVISSQIEAFKVDDFDTAFTFASPTIRNLFGSPENFGRMVSKGYPMVWRPAEVTYLDLRMEGGAVFQDVRIVDATGKEHLLEYRMQETESGWKINGVRLLEPDDVTA